MGKIVAIGGGNTLMMMRRWKFLGVDRALRSAYRRGAVLCGASAGAICWFESGHSDSMRGYGHDPREYIRVSGLKMAPGLFCSHFHHEDRRKELRRMIHQRGGAGLAVDDKAASEIVDSRFRVLAENRKAGVWVVQRHGRRVRECRVPCQTEFLPLSALRRYSYNSTLQSYGALLTSVLKRPCP